MKNNEKSGFYPPSLFIFYVYLWFVNSMIASCHKTRAPRPINGLRTFNTLSDNIKNTWDGFETQRHRGTEFFL